MGRSPKTEGASGHIVNSKYRGDTSPEVSKTFGKYHPRANRQPTARRLPQSPAVTAPSRRELLFRKLVLLTEKEVEPKIFVVLPLFLLLFLPFFNGRFSYLHKIEFCKSLCQAVLIH